MPRVNRRIPVDLYVNKMINGVPFLARTRDLSREGVFVHRLLEPVAPNGAHIAVEFALPGTGRGELECEQREGARRTATQYARLIAQGAGTVVERVE